MNRLAARVSNDAVKKATGKNWIEWFKILDEEKSMHRTHKEIARWLGENYEISGWWSQTVTVEYEIARGMRELHEKPAGFEVSVSRTMNADSKTVFRYFKDARLRKKWLGEEFRITVSTEEKSLRALWNDGTTRISVNFYPKAPDKSQVSVQHLKLSDGRSAGLKKLFWAEKLDNLRRLLK